MDTLDVIIIVVVVLAAVHGVRLGAAVQVLSFAGAIIGAALGIALVAHVSPDLHDPFTKTFVALLCLLVPTSLLWGVGRQIGTRIWRRLHGHAIAAVDSATGAVVAMAGALVVVWLLASMLAQSQVGAVSNQIENSAVLHAVTDVMPRAAERAGHSGAAAQQRRLLVRLPGHPALHRASAAADRPGRSGRGTRRRTVDGTDRRPRVRRCRPGRLGLRRRARPRRDERSRGRRHDQISVDYDGVRAVDATPVFFDPNFDLAVLRANVPEPALRLDPGYAGRGTKATVLGYPGGETSLDAQPAGVLLLFDPVSTNIYGTTSVQRQVYEVRALVRPGNSGGPLVESGGTVIGIVFSRAANENRIGFALASPGVRARVRLAEQRPTGSVASTGVCTDG